MFTGAGVGDGEDDGVGVATGVDEVTAELTAAENTTAEDERKAVSLLCAAANPMRAAKVKDHMASNTELNTLVGGMCTREE